jgi:hypothetical protein
LRWALLNQKETNLLLNHNRAKLLTNKATQTRKKRAPVL